MKKKTAKTPKTRSRKGALKDLEPKTSPKGGVAPGEWFAEVVRGVDLTVQSPSALKINIKK